MKKTVPKKMTSKFPKVGKYFVRLHISFMVEKYDIWSYSLPMSIALAGGRYILLQRDLLKEHQKRIVSRWGKKTALVVTGLIYTFTVSNFNEYEKIEEQIKKEYQIDDVLSSADLFIIKHLHFVDRALIRIFRSLHIDGKWYGK